MAMIHKFPNLKLLTKLVYDGEVFSIEFFILKSGEVPAEQWLESISLSLQAKFAALLTRLGDHGKIWNEQKFKHLTGSDQLFEFKSDEGRILCFFFSGKRVILTNGFSKKSAKTPRKEIELAHTYKKDFERRSKNETEE